MKDKVIIDTSVWIDYLQKERSHFSERVDDILLNSDIYVPKVVMGELIQGAHSNKEINVINFFLNTFHIIGESKDSWIEAGKLSYSLRKKGKTINLTDCYIAVIAMGNSCSILTLDKHFKEIQKKHTLKLIDL